MRSAVLNDLGPALGWLRGSGIQAPEGSAEAGGVHAWIDEASGEPAFLYSEITGYFMTLCCQLARLDPGADWLERAERAAGWIVGRAQHPSGAILSRKHLDGGGAAADPFSFERGVVAFFDVAMVGCGLLATHAATGNPRWLEAARRIGGFCLQAFAPEGGPLSALFDIGAGRPLDPADRWSGHFGPFEVKGLLFLERLAEATGDARFGALGGQLLDLALASQDASGRFPTDLDGSSSHLHPHSYTLEGLLYAAARLGRRDCLEAACRGIDWAVRVCLLGDARVQQFSTRSERVIPGMRSDALAQVLRAYEIAKWLAPGLAFPWEDRVGELDAALEAFALPSGGTSYGLDEFGSRASHANAWCHFFRIERRLFRARRLEVLTFAPTELLLT